MKNLLILSRFGLSILLVSASTACGLFGDKEKDQPVYTKSRETDALKVPDDLDPPRTDIALVIQGNSAVELTDYPDEPYPPRVSSGSDDDDSDTAVKYGARGPYILIQDSVDSVWRRLGLSIERSGMQIKKADLKRMQYLVEYQASEDKRKSGFFGKMAFWRKRGSGDYSGKYHLILEAQQDATRIYLTDNDNQPARDAAAEEVLGIFQNRLG